MPAEILVDIFTIIREQELFKLRQTSLNGPGKIGVVCLGLTCKKLYAIHWDLHGKMRDLAGYHERKDGNPVYLGFLLKVWMGPKLIWDTQLSFRYMPIELAIARRCEKFLQILEETEQSDEVSEFRIIWLKIKLSGKSLCNCLLLFMYIN